MQKPIEGLLANRLHCLIKRKGVSNREQQFSSKQAARKHKKAQTAPTATQSTKETQFHENATRIPVVHIANTYNYIVATIRFWDSLRLFTQPTS